MVVDIKETHKTSLIKYIQNDKELVKYVPDGAI